MFFKRSIEVHKVREHDSRDKRRRLLFALLLVVLTASFFGSIRLLQAVHSPRYVAKRYFKALLKGDVDEAYSCLAIPEGSVEEIIYAKDVYTQLMLPKSELEEIESSGISKDKKGQEIYVLTYSVYGGGDQREISVQMEKQKEKHWLIFPEWKVSLSDGLVKTSTIEVPVSAALRINGQEIGTDQLQGKKTDYGTKMYSLDLFRAFYVMEIEDELHLAEKRVVRGGQEIYWSANTIKPGVRKKLAENAADFMCELLEAAVNINKGVPDVVKISNAKYRENGSRINDSWKVLVNDCNPQSKYRLNSVTVTDFSSEPQLTGNENIGTWLATVPITYKYSYSARKGSQDTEGSGENRAELYLIWDNGKWELYDFTMSFSEWSDK